MAKAIITAMPIRNCGHHGDQRVNWHGSAPSAAAETATLANQLVKMLRTLIAFGIPPRLH
jgi:hypothetical protein